MLRCAFCGRALKETAAWKGRGERYYCNDFCAEAEEIDFPPLVPGVSRTGDLVQMVGIAPILSRP